MDVDIRVDRDGDRGRVVPAGPFDLAHAMAVERAVEDAEPRVSEGCRSVDVNLAHLNRIDGSGAALLARFLDRLDAAGRPACVVQGRSPEAERLVAVYRKARADRPTPASRPTGGLLARIGAAAADLPVTVHEALDFTGRCAIAIPRAIAAPRSVDWRSLPRLL